MERKTFDYPEKKDLLVWTYRALELLGGSADVGTICEKVKEIGNISQESLALLDGDGKSLVEHDVRWKLLELKQEEHLWHPKYNHYRINPGKKFVGFTTSELVDVLAVMLMKGQKIGGKKLAALAVFGILYGAHINQQNKNDLLGVTASYGNKESNPEALKNGNRIRKYMNEKNISNVFDSAKPHDSDDLEQIWRNDVVENNTHKTAVSIVFGIKYGKYIDIAKMSATENEKGNINLGINIAQYIEAYPEYKSTLLYLNNRTVMSDECNDHTLPEDGISYNFDDPNNEKEGENRVFYGTPGCGKSYHLKNEILKNFDKANVFRVTFHQDYTYTDFVGQILPIVKDDKVSYRFVPGPFTLAVEKAIISNDQKIALVIEELNRGNAASIFGDLFQLLDRKGGSSEYELTNVQITDYLNDTKEHKEDEKLHRCGVDYTYGHSYIKLPSNLYIYATMNTGDQNVFTLDTAFKRRWKFEKLSNEFNNGDAIGKKYVPGLKNVTWKTFVETVNGHMIKDGTFDSEDKQLGKYFVKPEMLLDDGEQDSTKEKSKEFAYKVLEYLWNDVAKFDREKWFDTKSYKTLDSIIKAWEGDKGAEIFNSSVKFAETPPKQDDAAGDGNQS